MTKIKTATAMRLPKNLKAKFDNYVLSSVIDLALKKFLANPNIVPQKKYDDWVMTRYTIDPDLKQQLKALAEEHKIASDAIIRMALEQFEV